jgi:nitrogen regulatory protein P-II 1
MLELITAIIKPFQVEPVRAALIAEGVEGMTVTEVQGFGRQRGKSEVFRGSEYTVNFVPKVKVEVVVPGDRVDAVVEAIANAARTGKIGDGKIWHHTLNGLMRIRNGDLGNDAV